MKTLVIRQPWAWAIIHAGKDIENRSWNTHFRGRFLVLAAKGMTRKEYDAFVDFTTIVPGLDCLAFGAIIGSVELVDVVDHSASKWFMGPKGFVLEKPWSYPTPRPMKGRLGFFETEMPL